MTPKHLPAPPPPAAPAVPTAVPLATSGRDLAAMALDLAHVANGHRLTTFLTFGIDNFRYLNAIHGPSDCDAVMATLESSLRQVIPGGQVFRLGSDTFGVLLLDTDVAGAEVLASRLLGVIRSRPLGRAGHEMRITVSAGIVAVEPEATPGDVLVRADAAMQAAKDAGRDQYAVFHPAVEVELATTAGWAEGIRAALESASFTLHVQPIRSLATATTKRWELLLRLPQENGGELLAPAAFLPVADRFGLVQMLDRWVLDRAAAVIRQHRERGLDLRLEVNLSVRSLLDPSFTEAVSAHVAAGMPAHRLVFEVSERDVTGRVEEVAHAAARLRDLGCGFALDNFGSEHGSLAYLKQLPTDIVKIDGSLIRHLADDPADRIIVRSIVDLVHALGSEVVAVHVGDEETLAHLRTWGVDDVQGFFIGPPQPLEALR